jgi:hypothetical protein
MGGVRRFAAVASVNKVLREEGRALEDAWAALMAAFAAHGSSALISLEQPIEALVTLSSRIHRQGAANGATLGAVQQTVGSIAGGTLELRSRVDEHIQHRLRYFHNMRRIWLLLFTSLALVVSAVNLD